MALSYWTVLYQNQGNKLGEHFLFLYNLITRILSEADRKE